MGLINMGIMPGTYKVIKSCHYKELEALVNGALRQGYVLVGGIAISEGVRLDLFCQAVGKERPKAPTGGPW